MGELLINHSIIYLRLSCLLHFVAREIQHNTIELEEKNGRYSGAAQPQCTPRIAPCGLRTDHPPHPPMSSHYSWHFTLTTATYTLAYTKTLTCIFHATYLRQILNVWKISQCKSFVFWGKSGQLAN